MKYAKRIAHSPSPKMRSSFYRSCPLERIARDFRGITHHPLTPEATLFYAGRVALGSDPEEI